MNDNPPPFGYPISDLRKWVGIVVVMAVAADLLHILLAGNSVVRSFAPSFKWQDWTFFVGAFLGLPAFILWLGNRWRVSESRQPWWALAIGLLAFLYQWLLNNLDGLRSEGSIIFLVLSPLGLLALTYAMLGLVFRRKAKFFRWTVDFFELVVLVVGLVLATNAGLDVTRIIFPATWDYHIFRIDGAFAGLATQSALLNASAPPAVQAFTHMAYAVLIFALYAMVGLAMRKNAIRSLHVWRTLVVPFALAFVLYAFLPVTGPAYVFWDNQFPDHLPQALDVVAKQVIVPPASRNAMPSMHLTGALLIWMLSVGLRLRVAILFSSVLALATAWATIATGEHYLLDLIVALPYAAFLGTALIWPERLWHPWRTSVPIWLTGLCFIVWMIALRVVPLWLSDHAWVVRLFSMLSVACAGVVFWGMGHLSKKQISFQDKLQAVNELPLRAATAPLWIIGTFAASGIAGLIYEVVYAKALAVTFGSSSLASYTVLATYMGGMALGAWLGGYVADRSSNPLRAYAVCEALIGLYAALTPNLFNLVQDVYVYFSLDTPPDAGWLTIFRVGLGAICLGLPTLLMGATMPLMFKHLRGLGVSSQGAIAPLYGANVAGAAIGSVIAGYLILPAVGRNGGTYLAAVLSLIVALFVLEREKRMVPGAHDEMARPNAPVDLSTEGTVNARIGATALAILFVGGAVTLGLEVNSMHLLAVVAGNSVYAFALMLATFLAGLGFGSHVGEWLMERFSRLEIVAWAQCGVACAIGVTAQTWDNLPSYFSSFSIYPVQLGFVARETIRAMVCATAMLPAAFFIGMSYPAAMSLASDWLSPRGGARGLGLASGINTLGNIIGVVLIGFWLLPTFGSRDSAFVLAAVALGLGLLALVVNGRSSTLGRVTGLKTSLRWSPMLAACVALWVFPNQWNYDDLATGSNVYFSSQNWGKVVDHAESVEGGLTSVAKNSTGVSTLLTNGKFQGNDSTGGEMVAQESFALFPLLHTSARDTALVIGYGTGMTTRVLHESGFKQVDVAELSKDIVVLANRHFGNINHAITDRSGVRMHYTDGRNFLLTQTQQFNLISIEITSIWFAGAANLYNQDFYALAKKRLTDKGVLQQWVQLHHVSPLDLAYVIGSVRSEFKYVWLYARGGQGIIVASNHADSLNASIEAMATDESDDSSDERQPKKLRSHLVLSPAGIDNFISSLDPSMSHLVSTDSNLYLEHSTPKGNALGNVLPSNLRLLSSFERVDVGRVSVLNVKQRVID